jgi:N-acetylglucosaminyl-diphospho-decaprenol L-rhamnosyltransferase
MSIRPFQPDIALTQTDSRRVPIAVSIINYRTAQMTLASLTSVLADMGAVDGRVAIIDNRSDDGSVEILEAAIAALPQTDRVRVQLIRSATNSGFSGGHNQGMAAWAADRYLILNSDAILRPGFFQAILAAAATAPPRTGLIAPRLEDEDGTPQNSCFRFPGPASELMRGAQSAPVSRLFRHREIALPQPPEAARVEWASFACILLDGAMVAAIGPMDEGYFLYFEDIEYCLRARRAGWGILYAPEARAVHFRGGSGPVKAPAAARRRLPSYYYASRSRFLAQAHGRAGLIAANLAWHAGRALARIRPLLGKPVPQAAEREARDLWTNALDPLAPRVPAEG